MKSKNIEGRKKKRIFFTGIALVALAVSAFAVFGEKGFYDLYKVRKERDNIVKFNKGLEVENKNLEEDIRLLKTDKRYVGQIARKELGMLGTNEVIYKIEAPKKDAPKTEAN